MDLERNRVKEKISNIDIGNTTKTEKTTTKNGLSFDEAMDTLLVKIQEDYNKWGYSCTLPKVAM